jgi:hypothetical protein
MINYNSEIDININIVNKPDNFEMYSVRKTSDLDLKTQGVLASTGY